MADIRAQIAEILAQKQQSEISSNPYILAAQGGGGRVTPRGRNTATANIANVLLSGLQGGMAGYGAKQANDNYQQFAAGIPQLLSQPGGLRNLASRPEYAEIAARLSVDEYEKARDSALSVQDAAMKAEANASANFRYSAPGIAMYGMPDAVPQPIGAPLGSYSGEQEAPGQLGQPAAPAPQMSGDPSIDQRARALFPLVGDPAKAYQIAADEQKRRDELDKPRREAEQKEIDELRVLRESGTKLKGIGDNALTYGAAAGETGPGSGLNWLGAQLASNVLPDALPYTQKQRDKLSAEAMLDQPLPDIVGLAKPPGSGGTSDYESRLYVGAGTGSHQLPETNKTMGELFKIRGQLLVDKADFKQTWKERTGTLQGAEAAWNQYLGDYQAVSPDAKGKPVINQRKQDWREFLNSALGGGNGAPPAPPQAPGAAMQAPQAQDPVTQAMIRQESGGNPNAVSPKGALGLMQVMPETGREVLAKLGLVQPGEDLERVKQLLLNPAINQMVGQTYYNEQLQKFGGNQQLALAAYNAGPGAVQKYGGVPPFQETQQYVQNIQGNLAKKKDEVAAPSPGEQQPSKPPQQRQRTPFAQGFKDYVYDPAGQVLQGATFNTGDEIVAGLRSLAKESDYDKEVAAERAELAEYVKENPKKAIAMQLAGGVMTLPVAAKAGLLKAGTTLAGTAFQGAKGSAILGAAYGAGAGTDAESRTEGGIEGGAMGAVLGAPLALAGRGAAAALGSEPVRKVVSALTPQRAAGAEAGMIGRKIAESAKPGVRPEDLAILKYSGVPKAEELQAALAAMKSSADKGGQLLVPEALGKPSLNLYSKKIANTPETMNIAKEFVEQRSAETPDRIIKAFSSVSDETSASAGAATLREATKKLFKAESQARSDAAKPFFEKAMSDVPKLTSPRMTELLDNKIVKRYVNQALTEVDNAGLAKDSSKVVQGALERMGAEIQALRSNKLVPANTANVRALERAKAALEKEAETLNPALKQARDLFSSKSEKLNKLTGDELKLVRTFEKKKPVQAVEELMRRDPAEISRIRDLYMEQHPQAWAGAIKSYVLEAVKSQDDAQVSAMLKPLIGSPNARERLRAALGNDLFKDIEPLLSLEKKYITGARQYFAGSPTQPLQEAAEKSNWIVSMVNSLSQGGISGAVGNAGKKATEFLFRKTPDQAQNQKIAEILFRPQAGQEFLERAAPYRQAVEKYRAGIESSVAPTIRGGGRELSGQGGSRGKGKR